MFRDHEQNLTIRVLQASYTYGFDPETGDPLTVSRYLLGVEDPATQQAFEVENVLFDLVTREISAPTEDPVVAVSALTSFESGDTAASYDAIDIETMISNGLVGLIDDAQGSSDEDMFSWELQQARLEREDPSQTGDKQKAAASGGSSATSLSSSHTASVSSIDSTASLATVASASAATSTYLGVGFVQPPQDDTDGDDVLTGTNSADTLYAGDGNDTLRLRGGDDYGYGGSGSDQLEGGNGDDVLEGCSGADTLKGGGGNDTADYYRSNEGVQVDLEFGVGFFGHAAGDTLDKIENIAGSSSNDFLIGDSGNNVLIGRLGDDQFAGGGGNDTFDGGEGNDVVTFQYDATSAVVIDLSTGSFAGAAAGNTYVSIESIGGSSLSQESDVITGDGGYNRLWGFSGDDTLDGAGGDDLIIGGLGVDLLTGGSGSDGSVWDSVNDSGTTAATRDLVTDFETGIDFLYLTGIDANWNATGNQAFSLIGTNAFGGLEGELRYEQIGANTLLEGDVNGDSNSDFSLEFTGLLDFSLTDFFYGSVLPFISGSSGDDTINGTAGDDIIAAGSGNDTVYGLAGNDALSGNDGDDALFGGDGDDELAGDAGADTLDGGAGADAASYYGAAAGVRASLADPASNTGDAVGDSYVSIENLIGSLFDDTLIGDAGDNVLQGYDGNDALDGGAGADTLDGGDGDEDWVRYDTAAAGVALSLATGGTAGDALGDSFISIENILGSAFDDTLIGDAGDNIIEGGAGADALDGGAGKDMLRYQSSTEGVVVDLAQGIGLAGDALGDTFTNFEIAYGSNYGDTIIGSSGYEELAGLAGDDTFIAGGGGDVIVADDGIDTIDFSWATQGVIANLKDTVTHVFDGQTFNANYGDVGADRTYIYLAENLAGSVFDDELTGSDGASTLEGGAGDDLLFGNGGNDILRSGSGNDYLAGDAGWDTVDYIDSDVSVFVTLTDTSPLVDNTGTTFYLNYAVKGGVEMDHFWQVEYVRGSNFDDEIIGSNGSTAQTGFNYLYGAGGNDIIDGKAYIDYLFGDQGDDTIYGGSGNDRITGGTENDELWGGSGSDVFLFATGDGVDVIEDFENGLDQASFGGGLSFGDLTIADETGGARVSYAATDSILFTNVLAADLDQNDFLFT